MDFIVRMTTVLGAFLTGIAIWAAFIAIGTGAAFALGTQLNLDIRAIIDGITTGNPALLVLALISFFIFGLLAVAITPRTKDIKVTYVKATTTTTTKTKINLGRSIDGITGILTQHFSVMGARYA